MKLEVSDVNVVNNRWRESWNAAHIERIWPRSRRRDGSSSREWIKSQNRGELNTNADQNEQIELGEKMNQKTCWI